MPEVTPEKPLTKVVPFKILEDGDTFISMIDQKGKNWVMRICMKVLKVEQRVDKNLDDGRPWFMFYSQNPSMLFTPEEYEAHTGRRFTV